MSSDTHQAAVSARSLRLLQVGSFTSQFDRLMIAPMLVVIAGEMGRSVEAVSRAAAFYFLCYGFAQIGWAVVSDRLGRVRTMRLALLLAMVGGLASAVVPDVGWLVAARGLTGACFAAAIPGALVYIGDTVPVAVRQAPLTDLMTSSAVGMAMATMTAGAIADFTSWRVAFALTAVVAGVLAFFLRGLREPELGPPPAVWSSLRGVLTNRPALLVLVLVLVEGVVLLGPLTFLPVVLHASGLSVTVSGLLTAAYGVSVLVFARVVKARTRTMAPSSMILIGGGMAVFAYVVLVITHGAVAVVVATVLLGGGWAFMHSTLQTWATDMAPGYRATAVSAEAFRWIVATTSARPDAGMAQVISWADMPVRTRLSAQPTLAAGSPCSLAMATMWH